MHFLFHSESKIQILIEIFNQTLELIYHHMIIKIELLIIVVIYYYMTLYYGYNMY